MLTRRTKRALIGITFGLATVSVMLFAVARFFENAELKRLSMEEAANLKPRPPKIHTIATASRTLERNYAAQVLPWIQSDIAAEVAGKVVQIHVEAGTDVRKGDKLISLDAELARHQLAAAEANLAAVRAQKDESERRLNEAKSLASDKVISETELKAIQSEVAVRTSEVSRAEAEANRLRELVSRHEIVAPFDGTVNQRMVDLGTAVNVNQTVAHLVVLDPLRVVFYVNEQELPNFQVGQTIKLSLTGRPTETLEPKIRFIPPAADVRTGLFRIEGELPNPSHQTPGGLQANIRAPLTLYGDLPFVPASAVRWNGATAEVQVKTSEGNYTPTPVEIGPDLEGFYPVFSGLKSGDQVLIR